MWTVIKTDLKKIGILKEDLAEGINEVSFSIDINRIKKFVSDENFIE